MPPPLNPANPEQVAGDPVCWGMDQRDPRMLAPGLASALENVRCTEGQPTTRKGVVKPGWANRIQNGQVQPWENPLGVGVFQDPNGVAWCLVATDGAVWRTRPYNQAVAVALPPAVRVPARCTFVQAFGRVYLFRGRNLKPLRLTTFDAGFEDVVPIWDAATPYAATAEVAYGPWFAAVTLSLIGDTATLTTATDHGLVTGQDVVVRGANQTPYNGRVNVTVRDARTLQYSVTGLPNTPATGTVQWSPMMAFYRANGSPNTPAAGESPESAPTKWTRVWNVLPNAETALYVNNRLLVPTAYAPETSDYTTFTNGAYAKVDYLVATDVLDEVHFDFSTEFRINQGSADEIVDLAKFDQNTVVIWKGNSWGVLTNVSLDLSQVSLDMRSMEVGLSARGAWAHTGSDLHFVSGRRGVISLRMSELGKLMSVELPFSAPVQKHINAIAWPLASEIRCASWESKLYVAVPLDGAQLANLEMVPIGAVYGVYPPYGEAYFLNLQVGRRYRWTPGSNEYWLATETALVTNRGTTDFIPTGTGRVQIHGNGPTEARPGPNPVTGSIKPALPGTCNTAILVYDFVAAARAGSDALNPRGWAGVDKGVPFTVKEWFKMHLDGVERLFFLGADGWVNLVEESYAGDQVADATAPIGLGWDEIAVKKVSRTYDASMRGVLRPVEGAVVLQTWNPKYSERVLLTGPNRAIDLVTDEIRDRTHYVRPWDAEDWNPTNVNDDHGTADRDDYSAVLSGSLNLGANGVVLDQMQEAIETFGVTGRSSRSFQIEITNTQGRVKMLGERMSVVQGRDRHGKQT